MQKIILLLMTVFLSLSGCVHKMDIEQGNVITQDMVNKLHVGMTQDSVRNLMGSPVLVNTFSTNRADYVYTFKPGRGQFTEKYITLMFSNGRLEKIEGNMYSQYINSH
jgi:outer membrane protein assembly factor BamE